MGALASLQSKEVLLLASLQGREVQGMEKERKGAGLAWSQLKPAVKDGDNDDRSATTSWASGSARLGGWGSAAAHLL